MDGSVEVSSRPGEGSEFVLRLPLLSSAAEPPRAGFPGIGVVVVCGGGRRAEALRGLIHSMAAHVVARAAIDDDPATVLANTDPSTVHLVLFDTPVAGPETVARVAAWAALPAVRQACTIRLFPRGHTPGAEVDGVRDLPKPFRRRTLERVLSQVVDGTCCDDLAVSTSVAVRNVVRPGHRPRVLVAEDNPVNRKVVSRILDRLGCDVRLVVDGKEAVAVVADEEFDAVFMDCQMPIMDGYEATRRIRQTELPGGRRLPIVALTANALAGDREKCLDAGMDDYLSKPVQRRDMESMLMRWVQGAPVA